MNKAYKLVSVIGAVVLLSGLMPNTADASASAGPSDGNTQGSEKPVYHHQQNHESDFDAFLEKCFNKWGIKWGDSNTEAKPAPEEPESPEASQPAPQPQPDTEQPAETDQNQQADAGQLSQFEQQVVELTNQERAKYGLSALEVDNELSKVAREKSRDMQINNYFDHNSPTYGSPFDMMRAYGIDYRSAGENIAKGQQTPEEVVNAWMNSEGHRANILNSSFTHIGVGYIEQGNIWTQQFIGK